MADPNDYVKVTVSLSVPRTPSKVAFGVLLIACFHTHWTERVRLYEDVAGMVADGFLETDPAVRAASVYFSSESPPSQLAIGRRALAPLQTLTLTLTSSSASDLYAATFVDSAGASHALSVQSTGVPATDAATIATAITGFALAGCTVSHTGAVVTLTMTAGHLTDIQGWPQFLNLADTTADPGIATDLAAILAANSLGWYGLALDSNSKAEVLAAAAWTEANRKFFFPNTSDFAVAAGTAANVQLGIQAASYRKTINAPYSGKQLLSYMGTAVAAFALGQKAGTYNLAWQELPGVTVDDDGSLTETQKLVINTETTSVPGVGGQFGNYYLNVANVDVFWPGCTGSGEWVDQVIGVDVMQADVQANIVSYIASQKKVPLTDYGITNVANRGAAVISTYSTPPGTGSQNALLDGARGIAVTKPTAASLSPTQRQSRDLTGISYAAFFSGAVNTVGVEIQLAA